MDIIASIMKFVVIVLIYIILYRIVKTMYIDLKQARSRQEAEEDAAGFALELVDFPESLDIIKGSVFPINNELTIGRKDDNQVVLDDPFISSHHANLHIKDERLYVKDLKSTNGTFKNDRRLQKEEELLPGDVLKIGRIVFKIIG